MSNIDATWMHIIDLGLNALAYTIISAIVGLVLRKRDVGHRVLLWLALSFAVSKVITCLDIMWNLYHGGTGQTLASLTPSSVITAVLALYLWNQFTNIVITLRRSEFGNKLKIDSVAEAEQRRRFMLAAATVTREESERSLAWVQQRESEQHVPDSDTSVGAEPR